VEVPNRALVPSELHELVCAGAQAALHSLRHLVVLHETGSNEAPRAHHIALSFERVPLGDLRPNHRIDRYRGVADVHWVKRDHGYHVRERRQHDVGEQLIQKRHPRADRPSALGTIAQPLNIAIRERDTAVRAEFLDHVDVAVSLHGYGRIGRSTQLLAGGRNRALAAHLARHIQLTGYQVVTDLDDIPQELRGLHPDNPVNRVRDGGTQLELSVRVRGLSPRSPLPGSDGLSPVTTALVQGLAAAARAW